MPLISACKLKLTSWSGNNRTNGTRNTLLHRVSLLSQFYSFFLANRILLQSLLSSAHQAEWNGSQFSINHFDVIDGAMNAIEIWRKICSPIACISFYFPPFSPLAKINTFPNTCYWIFVPISIQEAFIA